MWSTIADSVTVTGQRASINELVIAVMNASANLPADCLVCKISVNVVMMQVPEEASYS